MVRWLPLESNPDVMNKLVAQMGVTGEFCFQDVWGLDTELLAMVPQPTVAVLLLFPVSENYEAYRVQEDERIKREGQTVSPDVFYMKQTIGNACGTVALIHSIANNQQNLTVADGPLKQFISECDGLNPQERAVKLETCEGVSLAHAESAQEGQTQAPGQEDRVDLHFVAFVENGGTLYELDGRKNFAINHGPTTPATLLQDTAKVARQFMERDPDELRFTLVALAKKQ
eukprot:m.480843 g.480843  ORF g.480843 m.480843 type:complete len:229 (-) comp21969_c0_seq1:33-719(-)